MLKPVVLTVIKQVNSLLHFVFGEMTVECLVAHLSPPVFEGQCAADDKARRLNAAPEFGVVFARGPDKDAARPRIEGPFKTACNRSQQMRREVCCLIAFQSWVVSQQAFKGVGLVPDRSTAPRLLTQPVKNHEL